jgi:large subunit ribosomal protein L25
MLGDFVLLKKCQTLGCFSDPLFYCARFSHNKSLHSGGAFHLILQIMKQFKLNIVNREKTGRGISRRLRAEGNIPACVYSKGNSRSISLSLVEYRDLKRSIGGGAALIELVDEKGETALVNIQEVQRNALKNCITHIDFLEVARGESFVAHVPVHLVGEADAIGVKNEGGVIDHKAHEVEIRCRPSKLPDHIEVDVRGLAGGAAIHISDLPVVDGVEYLGTPIQVIVSCQPPTVAVASADADAVAADEVPASKVKDDAAEGGAE